ncbi:hypothetical protein N2152v2_008306 [Parachlorella kessleri]
MEENAYQVLGLENGPEASDADIKKVYRKLALQKHPDKNRDNPNAAAEFAELQKAYDLLSDAEARKALDDLLKAKTQRAERFVVRDEKRRRMMDELERREKQVGRERSQEEIARAKLKAEIERLRRQAAEREAKQYAEQRKAAAEVAAAAAATAASSVPSGAAGQEVPQDLREKLSRTLKVSWNRKEGEYSVAQLRAAFAGHGVVEDVVLRDSKKKKKGTALVVMATQEAAASAAASACGDLANPLLVKPFDKASGLEDDVLPMPLPPFQAAVPSMNTSNGVQPAAGPAFAAGATRSNAPAPGAAPLFPVARPPVAAATAGAAAVNSGGTGLPARPAAPLFAAGGAAFGGGGAAAGGGTGPGQRPRASLFPAGAAAAPSSSAASGLDEEGGFRHPGSQAELRGDDRLPETAVGSAGTTGGRPLFAAAAVRSGGFGAAPPAREADAGLASFGSYRAPVMQSAKALNREMEGGTLQKLRHAAERQRLVEQMQRDEAA